MPKPADKVLVAVKKLKMADNGRAKDVPSIVDTDAVASDRRAFLRKSAMIGVPMIVATVRPRTAWSQTMTASCVGSVHASGCNPNNIPLNGTIGPGQKGRGRT